MPISESQAAISTHSQLSTPASGLEPQLLRRLSESTDNTLGFRCKLEMVLNDSAAMAPRALLWAEKFSLLT